MRSRNHCNPFSRDSLGDALRPIEARRIEPPTQMEPKVLEAARAVLRDGPDAIDRIHTEASLEKLIDQTAALAEDLTGETRLRCLMSVRCLLDTQDSFHEEGIED